jgi:cephalosporin hydroxylase
MALRDNFEEEKRENIRRLGLDHRLLTASRKWLADSSVHRYSYNFTWLGLPIIQFPQDILALQEIVWRIKPDLIIETGIARGGSLVFYASMLELLGGDGQVLGIDIDIREHNRRAIESHPLSKRIKMIQGSSVDEKAAQAARDLAQGKRAVLVALDSNHTHAHVLRELNLYSPLVTKDSYIVVFDTVIEDMPDSFFPDKPWGKGNNPLTAVREFLKSTDRFVIDKEIENKLLITVAPDGYLRCLKR